MATKLESKVVRETTAIANDREIVITLTEDQKVSMRLKGMKSGDVEIGIKELWNQLNSIGDLPWQNGENALDGKNVKVADVDDVWEDEETPKKVKIAKDFPGSTMISLNKLRSLNAVTHSDLNITVKLDELIVDLLKGKK